MNRNSLSYQYNRSHKRNVQVYITNEEPSADCNKYRDDCDFFWYMQIMVMFVTYSQQSENKRGIALLSCPICPKIRIGCVHDLAKKGHLLDQQLVPMRTGHNEKTNRLGAHKKKNE